jgi:GNAT superfamily N-acetyltransferase
MNADIRAATRADVPAILELVHQLAAFENLTHEVSATPELMEASLFPAQGKPAAECVLAFVERLPVGYALVFPTFSTFLAKPGLYLEDLFVKPEFRRQGIGRALMLHVAGLAAKRGCGRLEWTVLDWNRQAIEFYSSFGAKTLPDWRICRLTGDALLQHSKGREDCKTL